VVAVLSAGGRLPGTGSDSSSAVGSDSAFRGEEILGTRGHDVLEGTSGRDLLFAFGGDDRIYGGDGSDLIDAGNGHDVITAGPGGDRIRAFDGERDIVRCGEDFDSAYVDDLDLTFDCEDVMETHDLSSPATPDPPTTIETTGDGATAPAPIVRGTVLLEDEAWSCVGPVDVDLVKVRISSKASGVDAVSLGQYCTGRIGRIEIDTWAGDGIKVQNTGEVAHDLVIESGYVACHAATDGYHQDGLQVMGGRRLTFRNMTVTCGGPGVNAALFIAEGGTGGSEPVDIVFENGTLGPGAAHTILLADALRSGARNTVICPGRYSTFRTRSTAVDPIMENNTERAADDPACQTE